MFKDALDFVVVVVISVVVDDEEDLEFLKKNYAFHIKKTY